MIDKLKQYCAMTKGLTLAIESLKYSLGYQVKYDVTPFGDSIGERERNGTWGKELLLSIPKADGFIW